LVCRSAGADHSSGNSITVPVPSLIENGLLAGLGIINAPIPELFPPGFFDISCLNKIWLVGVANYQEMCNKYHHSGNHGGKPYWFFVAPTLTVKQEEQHLHLKNPAKRWDSLAFYVMFQQVQELKRVFCKIIPNGKGGPASATMNIKGEMIAACV
jgi:hypothetical protein